ncbi:hypothetical protein B0E38_00032 [Streptomyces sp. 111WW2]|nr:hypothetical protein B0E38_00032 [Streptomyces sp. 111WW2]
MRRVAARGFAEGGDAVRDRFESGEGGAAVGEGPQHGKEGGAVQPAVAGSPQGDDAGSGRADRTPRCMPGRHPELCAGSGDSRPPAGRGVCRAGGHGGCGPCGAGGRSLPGRHLARRQTTERRPHQLSSPSEERHRTPARCHECRAADGIGPFLARALPRDAPDGPQLLIARAVGAGGHCRPFREPLDLAIRHLPRGQDGQRHFDRTCVPHAVGGQPCLPGADGHSFHTRTACRPHQRDRSALLWNTVRNSEQIQSRLHSFHQPSAPLL